MALFSGKLTQPGETMPDATPLTPGIAAGRLSAETLSENFDDLHPAYAPHEAAVASDRCYFCHDAPCVTACPTDIDIPLFIRQIQTGTPEAAARTFTGACALVIDRQKPYPRKPASERPHTASRSRLADCSVLQLTR